MKNLELLEFIHKPIGEIFLGTEVFSQTPSCTYFIRSTSLYKHDFEKNLITELCPQSFIDTIHIKHLIIEDKICVVTKTSIHVVDPDGINELQTLNLDFEIAAISWNPGEELVAIITSTGDVITYSMDYENCEIFQRGRSSVLAKVPDTVYVGWGSKDTQFKGSEGKLKKQTPVKVEPISDHKPVISWRGNGEMFVVNYWVEEKRKFVVFETPCQALYRSEDCPGLQHLVAWRPAGNMIATVAEANDKQSIVIFEKNGQKRFDFDLNFGNVRIKELKWSPCAQILTILSEDISTKSQTIRLITSSNYKWYQKQTLTFTSDNPLLNFEWLDTTQFTFTLRVVTKSSIVRYLFRNIVTTSSGICAVIDGATLFLTNFNESIVPPIMCSRKLVNSSQINFVCWHDDSIAIIDVDNKLKIFDMSGSVKSEFDLKVTVDAVPIPLAYHHLISEGGKIYFAAETSTETIIYNLSPQNVDFNFVTAVTDPIHFLLSENTSHNVVYQDIKTIEGKIYNCQLTFSGHFYVNNDRISDCVNSYLIFDKYLMYTTKSNELFCLRLNQDLKSENYRRNIEQGANIITPILNSPKIVLQLPRGNLETISCRLISIDILDALLKGSDWEEALRFIRLEKLNANLLFDLDGERFLGQIDRFIDGAKTINELNSLCLEFEEGNVLETIYRNWGEVSTFPGKIKAIFEKIFKYFDKVDYADYITTIMIINLNFFELRRALVYLQDLLRRSYDDVSLKQKLTEAINTLKTYGCDQEKLYTEALLLYDLDLAHYVASCCQLDPRIFEPQINNLKNLSEVERRYEINSFAKRPQKAISYLLRCPNITSATVSTFIKSHSVSREAYDTCPKNSRHYRDVSRNFAQDLSRRGCHEEAGVVLKRAGLLKEGLEEFQLTLKWRQVLNLLEELKVDDVEKMKVVDGMAKRLCQSHMIHDAAILYEVYAGNYEMAVKVLVDNYLFEEALHVAKKYNRGDIIVSEVIPLLVKHKIYLGEKLADLNSLYDKYRTRLAEVRRKRVDKLTNLYNDDDRDDLFSDVGSTITRSSLSSRSRYSSASSRNRRKEEKKKQNLREGGIYEDIALIRALHSTIKEIYDKGDEVRTCCLVLMQESDISYNEIKKFHDFYWWIDANVKKGIGQIWPPHFFTNSRTQNIQEMADLENFEHLDVEYRTPPKDHFRWKLTLF